MSFEQRYAWYRQLHAAGPVHALESGAYLVVGHDAVATGLRDSRLRSNKKAQFFARFSQLDRDVRRELEVFYSGWLMYMDGEGHRAYRGAAARALGTFTEDLRDRAEAFFAQMPGHGHIDGLEGFARPWVREVMPLFLGCSPAAYERMLAASVAVLDFFIGRRAAPKDAHAASHAYDILTRQLVEAPVGRGFLASLLEAMPDDPLVLPLAASVIADTWEPVVALLAAGLLHGCRRPHHDALHERNFFREVLRAEAPFQICNRVASVDATHIAGAPLARGQRVSFVIGAANRDPNVFHHPDRFDPSRAELRSVLSFGAGPHACIGGKLTEAVCRAGWEGFAAAVPISRMKAVSAIWRPVFGLRILDALVLAPTARASTDPEKAIRHECQAH